jgi:hypothetical protein
MANQQIFFENIGRPNNKIELSEEQKQYLRNCLIFEVTANWSFVQELMNKYKNGKLVNVDPLERDWFNFMIENNVDVDKYESPEKFAEDYLK